MNGLAAHSACTRRSAANRAKRSVIAFRVAGGFRLTMGLLQFSHGCLLLVPGAFQSASQLVDVVL